MINQLISFSINHKLIIGLLTLALIVAGIWSIKQVPIDAVPDITNNQVQVITQAPNLGTEDIEQFVTYPVELAMANLPGVKEVRSVSRFGLSVVTIVFEDNQGTYLPRQLVAEKLNDVKDEIPEEFGNPMMGPISTGLGEIYQYTLEVDSSYHDKYSNTDLRTIQDWIIKRQMAMVPGVVEVNAFGGKIKQYEVAVSPDELRAIGITMGDIFEALEKNNQNTGGAYIERNHQANFIRGEGLVSSLDEIKNISVINREGLPIKIKDVADVRYGEAVRYGALTKNGQGEAVGGMILMLKGANSDQVIQAVKSRILQIQQSLPDGISIKPFLDRSKLVEETTSTVTSNLLEGGLIVIFVLVILLGNWRGGLIVASTIPLSLLFAFILMNVFDVWANLMSLGAIDFGIIVDGAVIIVESTVFLLHQKVMKGENLNKKSRQKAASQASKSMMNAAFFGQLIILIVFLPILALEGVEGKMFKPMALTFIFAMLGAMILCLTYVPMVSSFFIRVDKENKTSWGDKVVIWLEDRYTPLLQSALRHGKWVLGISIVLFGLTVFTFSRMGGEFIPQLDEGDIAFHIILNPGSSLSESIATSTKIENIILDNFPEVDQVLSRFGVADVPTDPMPMDIGDCFIILNPRSEWVSASTKEELIEKIKDKISVIPGVSYEFTQPIEMRFNELLTGVREDIAIKLFGEDLEVLAQKANEIGQIVSSVEGVADMKVEATTGLPQMTINYDREKLSQYDLDVEDLNTVVQTAFAGKKAGVIFEGEKRFDLVVRLDSLYRTQINDVQNLYVNTVKRTQIPLKEVADISYQPGPMQISRDNTNRRTYVGINVRGRDVKSLVQEIKQKLDSRLDLPAGYYIRYGGAFENLERATSRLKLVVPLALASIFILIFFALGSLRQTFMIYMAIPLAAIGGVFSLWIRGMPFSISAGVGFIVLFGVAVLNGLVLINGLNELKEDGNLSLLERINKGTRRRIRPILLTALTDILGFLPMAISSSSGAEVQRPLATVVIGGLITSTMLTLFVLPILYQWMEAKRFKMAVSKPAIMLGFTLMFGLFSFTSNAQEEENLPELTLQEAIQKAKDNYPMIKSVQLEIDKQEALRKTAWDLGNTQIFTGGEEITDGVGVYTQVGFQVQELDIFGVPAKSNYQKQQVALAEAALNLSEVELSRQVSLAFKDVYLSKLKYQLLLRMDSLYGNFEKAAKIRYDIEATSKLEWLAAQNRSGQIEIQKNQGYYDYKVALQKFNLWLVSDTLFTTSSEDESVYLELMNPSIPISEHPQINMANEKRELAEFALKAAKSGYLPKLSAQYGIQEVSGNSGYYSYQLGISVPLAFNQTQAKVQSAKISLEQANQSLRQTQMEFQTAYRTALQNYNKWRSSYQFYKEEALRLVMEQEKGALLAYREGAIDYVAFLQNLSDALTIEMDALETLDKYLESKIALEYFQNPLNESNNE
ncbi:CusA/CzcA family heavy metal efflux RND transporter [Echinicola sp. CAU 1574]|uniref:CusA/CzcA family heavy metal efflux RND transporter n=1 Tax=Echinicola arenosa TaxID=2774144 RepID=A0ABR9AKJ9_9BACT|nr:CusA/CzcA family heavy metal efflux RND transporter [Echinicola arenosa]MBD8489343.1 CusA/CzcA family heavy metal efflux RND transporter [Echinicola arenosa]